MLRRGSFGRVALLVVGLALYVLGSGCTRALADEPYRALRAALYHMKEAKEEIKDERFSRHRERVEKDLREAIREIERALGEAKVEVKYEPARGWDEKYKSFKNLRQAMAELELAKEELRKEKGDWARRKELMGAIEDARTHLKDAFEEIK
jgi:hypothetical protein